MSGFKFGCPECGRKISSDTGYIGAQINCPACGKLLTVPPAPAPGLVTSPEFVPLGQAIAPANPAPPPVPSGGPGDKSRTAAKPSLWELATAKPAEEEAAEAKAKERATGDSILAMVSLFCSVWVLLGFIPGIICGHLARAKMRWNPLLKGKGMATAGLAISYTIAGLMLAVGGPILLAYRMYQPKIVERESAADMAALKPRIVDAVTFGPAQEGGNESAHKLQSRGYSESGTFAHKYFREGMGFSYEMAVLPNAAMSVNCRYYGSETMERNFDIIVEDQIVGTQDLHMNNPGHYFDVEYKIPPGVTKGKSKVTVEIEGKDGMMAGRVFALQTLQR